MTTAIQIAKCLLIVPMVLASASAMAVAPATKAVQAKTSTSMSTKSARRVVAGVMVGSVLAFGVQVAHAADAETQGQVVSVAPLNLTLPKSTQPNYAELANAQLRAAGIPAKPVEYQSLDEKVNGGLLGPLHKIAEERYFETGSDGARVARFLTDSKHMRYGYNLKKREVTVQFRANVNIF